MNPVHELVSRGGPVMIALMAVSVVLYERCFHLLLVLYRARHLVVRLGGPADVARVRQAQDELRESFRRQRIPIDAMITAAPLLGLLGTVMGMIAAFNHLSGHGGQRSMEGLAQGISEVLIATESGLAVALPALLLVYYAHRQMQKRVRQLAVLESRLLETH